MVLSLLKRTLPLAAAILVTASASGAQGLVALRVGAAETVSDGRIEHAVILIEKGEIVTIGQDLPVERGIRVVDLSDWTVMPGLVNARSRMGMDGEGGSGTDPHLRVSKELWPRAEVYDEILEHGVTTLGLYPAGSGMPGQSVAVRPVGETDEEMIVRDPAYLRIVFQSSSGAKKMIRDGFEEVDEYQEELEEDREKWEKKQERKKRRKKKDDDDDEEDEEDDDDDEQEEFVPEEPDEEVVPFIQLRSGELRALVEISRAADYLHLVDAIGDEEFTWDLYVDLRDDIDLHEVVERIGEKGLRVVLEPRLTLVQGTMRRRNLPRELVGAGARVAFVPRRDALFSHETWRADVASLLASGLPREAALRGLTLEPATALGLGDRLGSLEPGKAANLLFLDGDPLDVQTRVKAVMIDGRFVHGEVN